jgi:predicted amidohydrolase
MDAHPAPRKVVVGSCIYPMYASKNPWPGLEGRLEQLAGLIEAMDDEARATLGTGLDLAVLPEVAVNGGLDGDAQQVSFPFPGLVQERMAEVARRLGCYIVVPMFLAEEEEAGFSNACVLVGRDGEPAGTYRKVFPVSAYDHPLLEGGVTPGTEFPVSTAI